MEVRGEVRWLGEGSGLKNGGETAGATSGGELQQATAPLLLPASRGTGREKKEKRNGVSLVTWLRRLSGEDFTGAAMRGVAGGTVAGMGAGVGETEQNRNFRFPNPEPPVLGQNRFNFGAAKTKIFAQQLEIWPK